MLVDDLLPVARAALVTIADDARLIEAAQLLRAARTNLIVVINKRGAMVGVMAKTDIIGQISQCEGHSCITAAAIAMTPDVVSCRPGDRLHDVWLVMKQRGLKHIPVIGQDGRPMGILNAHDVIEALLREVQDEATLLRDYVACVGYH
jgi:CBS domain-containing protein